VIALSKNLRWAWAAPAVRVWVMVRLYLLIGPFAWASLSRGVILWLKKKNQRIYQLNDIFFSCYMPPNALSYMCTCPCSDIVVRRGLVWWKKEDETRMKPTETGLLTLKIRAKLWTLAVLLKPSALLQGLILGIPSIFYWQVWKNIECPSSLTV
jgi:hypothetical protein